MTGTASSKAHRLAFVLVAVSVILWMLARLASGVGWGAIDRLDGPDATPLGIAHGIEDNLSYAAWAEQARDGLLPFTMLYTTEPHAAIFVSPVFVALGWIAAVADVHPLLVMNLAALAAGALTLFFVFRTALAMGLSGRAALLAMVLTAYGSGLSAVTLLLSGDAPWAKGADATYLDLIPSSALPYFPYDCIALAAVMALVLALLRAEARLMRGARRWPALLTVFGLGLLAIAIRPYTPVSLVVVYAALAALTVWRGTEPGRRRARLLLLAALSGGIGPLAFYYHWVAGQPIWTEFAAASLELPATRLAWLIGFGLFWPLAAIGAAIGLKQGRRRFDLVSLWAGFVFALLLVANPEECKLADGGFIALALLAAHALDRAIARVSTLPRYRRLLALEGLGLVLLAAGLSTLAVYSHSPDPDYHPLDREIALAANQIRTAQRQRIPTVLTEFAVGAVLPPLASLRVYAGHWSLTVDSARKVKLLAEAGFEPESPGESDIVGRRKAYAKILSEAAFDWVLVRRGRPVVPLLRTDPQLHLAYRGERWLLFRRTAP